MPSLPARGVNAEPFATPDLPEGRAVELTGRGTTWVREAGPLDGAPVLLLHGWTASSALNWFASYRPLAEAGHRVLAIDHRGHGRGIRSARRFRLADCADDAVALLDIVGVDRAIVVGYSMGGPIAQLLWQRHPSRVDGLVLCATATRFRDAQAERVPGGVVSGMFGTASFAARLLPPGLRSRVSERVLIAKYDDTALGRWAAQEARRNHLRSIIDAAHELSRFDSSDWIGRVDVPTAVVLSERDQTVPPEEQQRLADSITGATVHRVDARHDMCATRPDRFNAALLAACRDVHSRID